MTLLNQKKKNYYPNCREILDSDSEKSSREKLKKGISKHTISLSNEDDYEEKCAELWDEYDWEKIWSEYDD